MIGLQRGDNILIDITGIDHGYDLQGFGIGDSAAIHQLLFNPHLFGHPGSEFAATMYKDLLSFHSRKALEEGLQFGVIINDIATDFYDV